MVNNHYRTAAKAFSEESVQGPDRMIISDDEVSSAPPAINPQPAPAPAPTPVPAATPARSSSPPLLFLHSDHRFFIGESSRPPSNDPLCELEAEIEKNRYVISGLEKLLGEEQAHRESVVGELALRLVTTERDAHHLHQWYNQRADEELEKHLNFDGEEVDPSLDMGEIRHDSDTNKHSSEERKRREEEEEEEEEYDDEDSK